ncbi:hypothetical protein [Moraxella bovis]|uniref:Uncharacterized protein n=1 Tax=Moraxella bovis TaxID=476 RepID=A0A1T0A3D2_MORBO|nr:hypothetical protein [Moraxella bovis]OOR89841.1 hypothetical protein B0182_06720 [Moraxella bovis]STY93340.1 Uncharacterised protein [Moraxella bovis]
MKTLSVHELNTLANFNYARSLWSGDDTKTVKIDYDAEYQDFAVITSEKNVRKNRISKLQAEITAWAESQLKSFEYAGLTVATFHLSFGNDEFGIELTFGADETEPVNTDTLAE